MLPEERLRFHVTSGEVRLSFSCNYETFNLQKSTDLTTWEEWSPNTPTVIPEGGDLYVFNPNATCCIQFQTVETIVNSVLDCSGNVMSLIADGEGTLGGIAFKRMFMDTIIRTAPELPATSLFNAPQCYEMMFEGCSRLEQAPELPATTLSKQCYRLMFAHCPSLITPPSVLPATALQDGCYEGMFMDTRIITPPEISATTMGTSSCDSMFMSCGALTTAPQLFSTILKTECYCDMFAGCSSLETAPELPATTLATSCYDGMFRGCTSLTDAPSLPADTLKSGCYKQMFQNCTSLINVPELSAQTLADSCYEQMFESCTSLVKAPNLPATTLSAYCYQNMFHNCTSIVEPIIMSATTLATNCCSQMFSECTSLRAPIMILAKTGVSGACSYMFSSCSSIIGGQTETDENKYLYRIPYGGEYDGDWSSLSNAFGGTPVSGMLTAPHNIIYTKYPPHSSVGYFWLQNEREVGDCQVTFEFESNLGIPTESHVQYSTNLVDWNDVVNDGEVTVSFSDRIYLKNLANVLSTEHTEFHITSRGLSDENKFSANGDLNVLINNSDLSDFCFRGLFIRSHITAAYIDFNLPLTDACFFQAFEYCDSLEYVSDLTAEIVPDNAYSFMFSKSHKLVIPPKITATQMGNGSCRGMFKECTSLTTTPKLSAMNLDSNCYAEMFYGCTSLTKPCKLPATELQAANYESMFQNCTGITLKEEKTPDYSVPYRIPTSGTATIPPMSLYPTTNMFRLTTSNEDRVETPELGRTYYLYGRDNGVYHYDGTKWILDANVGSGGGSTDVEVDEETITKNADDKIAVKDKGLNATKLSDNVVGRGIKKSTDGIQIESFVPYGATFPLTPAPQVNDQFILTTNTSTKQAGLYRFNGTEWVPLSGNIRCGDELPDSGIENESFILTSNDEDNVAGLYRFNYFESEWMLVSDKPYEIILDGVDPESPVEDIAYHIFRDEYNLDSPSKITIIDRLSTGDTVYFRKALDLGGELPLIFNSELNVWNFNPKLFDYEDIPMSDIPPCWINYIVLYAIVADWGILRECDEASADYKMQYSSDYWGGSNILYPLDIDVTTISDKTYLKIVDEVRPYTTITVSDDGSVDSITCTLDNTTIKLNDTSIDSMKSALWFMATDMFAPPVAGNLYKIKACKKEQADFVVYNNKITVIDGASNNSYISGEFGEKYLAYTDSKILVEDELQSIYPKVRYVNGISMTNDNELTSILQSFNEIPIDTNEFIEGNCIYVDSPIYDITFGKFAQGSTVLNIDKPFICDNELYKSASITLTYEINADNCKKCGMCAKNCPTGAISGDRTAGFTIDQSKCIHCGSCKSACRFSAVISDRSGYYINKQGERIVVFNQYGWLDDKYRNIKIAQSISDDNQKFITSNATIQNISNGAIFRLSSDNCWEEVLDYNNVSTLDSYSFIKDTQSNLPNNRLINVSNETERANLSSTSNLPCVSVQNTLVGYPTIVLPKITTSAELSGYTYTFELINFDKTDDVDWYINKIIETSDNLIPTISIRYRASSALYEFNLHYGNTTAFPIGYSAVPNMLKTGDVVQVRVEENTFAEIINCTTNRVLARWTSETDASLLRFNGTSNVTLLGTDTQCQIGIMKFEYSDKIGNKYVLNPLAFFDPSAGYTRPRLGTVALDPDCWIANGSKQNSNIGGISTVNDYLSGEPLVVSKSLYKHNIVFCMPTTLGTYTPQFTVINYSPRMSSEDFWEYLKYNHRGILEMWTTDGIDPHYIAREPQMPLQADCIWGTSGLASTTNDDSFIGVFRDVRRESFIAILRNNKQFQCEEIAFGNISYFRDFPQQIS